MRQLIDRIAAAVKRAEPPAALRAAALAKLQTLDAALPTLRERAEAARIAVAAAGADAALGNGPGEPVLRKMRDERDTLLRQIGS